MEKISDRKKQTIIHDVEKFVASLFQNYVPVKITEPKIIHDPILGSNTFHPYEIALLDTPICQRLRHITQTDVASIVFPSAHHNRLEHSLGVAVIAGRMMQNLRTKAEPNNNAINGSKEIEVRMAAILHDVGHGIFSHLSENIYGNYQELKSFLEDNKGMYDHDKPHEVLSHLIIKSSCFSTFFEKEILKKYKFKNPPSLARIAELIVSSRNGEESDEWQKDIINGSFDADKFDYLIRDAYFSGLKIGIDLDRFLHCIWIDNKPGSRKQIKVMSSGAIALEQICFGKLVLFNSIYHHHKIRATECLLKSILLKLTEQCKSSEFSIKGRKMNRAIDYLYVTEEDILSTENKPPELADYIKRLLNRDLLKRALVISSSTVKNSKCAGYLSFKALEDNQAELKALNDEFIAYAKSDKLKYDIWIDLPHTPTFEETGKALIQDPSDKEPQFLRDYFRVEEWLTAYASNKWRGYLFGPSDENQRKEIGNKFASFISSHKDYSFDIDLDKSFTRSKIK